VLARRGADDAPHCLSRQAPAAHFASSFSAWSGKTTRRTNHSSKRMALADDFAASQVRVKELPQPPSTDELLELYALYKQATAGDVQGSRPGMLDFKGRAKYDAWAARKGTDAQAAMQAYVALVARLVQKYAG
jgi:diazepam-binding inhibitor (GABA receptor modulator, acyl-CoA-binding protein)